MAEIILNPDTGMYDAIDEEGDVIYDGSVNADTEIPDSPSPVEDDAADILESEEDIAFPGSASDYVDNPVFIQPFSTVDNDASFTPRDWQLNLAEHRGFGEHYLLWAVRSGNYSRWTYYLALGSDINYDESSSLYTYSGVELYSYYDDGNTVTYEVTNSSGSVSGETYLVYSDLYFDYIGADPASSPVAFLVFLAFMLLFVLLIVTRRR